MADVAVHAVTPAQVARLRLRLLALHAGDDVLADRSPAAIVRHHLAMQAQDFPASRWAIGVRMGDGARDGDVTAAYDAGEVVRTWTMRGTIHAIAAADVRWMLDLTGVRALAGVQKRWEYLGIDEPRLERAREVATTLLRGGNACSRGELATALADAGLDLAGQRLYHTVWYLAQTGTLVLGPTRDGEHLLTLLDEWVPATPPAARDEALAELARRYLASHGPAGIDDLAWWTKLPKRDCRAGVEACGDDLVELHCGERRLLMLRQHHERLDPDDPAVDAAVHALPGFDEHLLGYALRDDVLDPRHATKVDPGRNGVFRWTIVAGSRVVATWRRTRRTRDVAVAIEPLARLSQATLRAARPALDRYGAFVGMPVTLR